MRSARLARSASQVLGPGAVFLCIAAALPAQVHAQVKAQVNRQVHGQGQSQGQSQGQAQSSSLNEVQALQGLVVELRTVSGGRVPVHYYFWKDGHFCDGLPSGGVEREPADLAGLQTQLPCGQYSAAGQVLKLSATPATEAREIRLQRSGDGKLSMNGNPAYKVSMLPAASAMAGTYSAMVTGSQTSRQIYEFRADGSYQFTSSPMTSEDGSPARQSGVFKAQGNSLQLSNSPGGGASGLERLTAYPFPGGGLMIEGTVFTR